MNNGLRTLFAIICLTTAIFSQAQKKINIDSIKKNTRGVQIQNVETQIKNLKSICEYYQYVSEDSTIKYAKILEKLGRTHKNANGIFNGITFQVYSLYNAGSYEKCLEPLIKMYQEIKPLKSIEVEVEALNKISKIYGALKNADSARYYNKVALDLSLKAGYSLGKIMCYDEIGANFYREQILDSALLYLLKGEKTCSKQNKPNNYCASISKKIAKIHVHKREYEMAIQKYKLSQKQFIDMGNTKAYYTTNTRIADVLTRMGKYAAATNKLDSSYLYFKSKNYYPDLATCLSEMSELAVEQKNYTRNLEICKELEALQLKTGVRFQRSLNKELGQAYYLMEDFPKAIYYLEKAYDEAIAEKSMIKQENALYHLANANSNAGNHRKANEYYKLFIKLNDTNEELKNSKYTSELQTKYDTEKKEHEIAHLQTKNELAEQQKNSQLRLLGTGIAISSLLGLFFFIMYRNRKKVNDKLKEVDVIKTRFFENISHEFRTPLTLIKLPLSQAITNNQELHMNELNLMHNNASRLQNLIEDLLSLSELEAGKVKIVKSEQDPLVQAKTLSLQFDSYAESKGISYQKVIDRNSIKASYDKSVLDKVLTNLISNAIKYSETGGTVQVSVSIVEQNLVMKVSDKGEGITPEDQKKIFDRFYRVGSSDEGRQGSGIGLALVKRLLKINGGSIEVTSKINEGSTFTATIPIENIEHLPFDPTTEEVQTKAVKASRKVNLLESVELSNKPKLLIAEDSQELLEYISTLFQDDFQIINAEDGVEGMEKALEIVPDFIISDWMMPRKNGLEFCKEIKTNTATSHIPFLLLTAKSMVEDKIEGYDTGADAYFSKPFNFNELKSRINGLMKQRQMLYEKYSNLDIQLSSPATNSLDVKFWEEFKKYLKENIRNSDLNANQISEHMGMSRMQLHRKLTALSGQNLSAFIKSQRMNLAGELLKDKSLRISDVCYEIGYEDNSAFARAFKKEYGLSPTQYKDKA